MTVEDAIRLVQMITSNDSMSPNVTKQQIQEWFAAVKDGGKNVKELRLIANENKITTDANIEKHTKAELKKIFTEFVKNQNK